MTQNPYAPPASPSLGGGVAGWPPRIDHAPFAVQGELDRGEAISMYRTCRPMVVATPRPPKHTRVPSRVNWKIWFAVFGMTFVAMLLWDPNSAAGAKPASALDSWVLFAWILAPLLVLLALGFGLWRFSSSQFIRQDPPLWGHTTVEFHEHWFSLVRTTERQIPVRVNYLWKNVFAKSGPQAWLFSADFADQILIPRRWVRDADQARAIDDLASQVAQWNQQRFSGGVLISPIADDGVLPSLPEQADSFEFTNQLENRLRDSMAPKLRGYFPNCRTESRPYAKSRNWRIAAAGSAAITLAVGYVLAVWGEGIWAAFLFAALILGCSLTAISVTLGRTLAKVAKIRGTIDEHEIVYSRSSNQVSVSLDNYPHRMLLEDCIAMVNAGGERAIVIGRSWFGDDSTWVRVCRMLDATPINAIQDGSI